MQTNEQFAVILPAAGSGTRFGTSGGAGDKLMVDLAGMSVLQRSVDAFARRPDVLVIVIVTAPDRFDPYREHLSLAGEHAREKLLFVPGGRERWESVLFGLRALAARDGPVAPPKFVAIHDAARPLISQSIIDEAFRATRAHGAALPCVPEPATLKRLADNHTIGETVDRRGLYQAQTPQCFELGKLLAGYEKLFFTSAGDGIQNLTDDAQVYERMGWSVKMTPGSASNLKVTTADDVDLARALLAAPTVSDER